MSKSAKTRRKVYDAEMDEGRKRVIGIMAAILAARKLAQYDGGKRVPATVPAISDAVRWAEEILRAGRPIFRASCEGWEKRRCLVEGTSESTPK